MTPKRPATGYNAIRRLTDTELCLVCLLFRHNFPIKAGGLIRAINLLCLTIGRYCQGSEDHPLDPITTLVTVAIVPTVNTDTGTAVLPYLY